MYTKYSVIIPYYDCPELRFALDSYAYYYSPRMDTEIIIVEASENYFSENLHTQLLSLIDKYRDSIKIRAIVDSKEGTSMHNKYLLGAKIATGDFVMLTTSFTAPNFDFFEKLESENLYNTCVVCGCVGVRVLEDRGTFLNSDFVFDRWYQHSQYINRIHNFCCILSKQDYIGLKDFGEENFFSVLEGEGVAIWTRDDIYAHVINYPMSLKEYNNVYDLLYRETEYDIVGQTNNEEKWGIISKLISNIKFNTVVDLGCGRGYYLKKFIEMEKESLGVELSKICCEKYLKDLPHVCSDIENFSVNNNKKYDLVVCMDVMEHIDPDKVEQTIKGIRPLSDVAIFGVANHVDNELGFELHLTVEDSIWWEERFKKFYAIVETLIFSERFYYFKCRGR